MVWSVFGALLVFAMLYLLAVILGVVPTANRLGQAELIIVALLLIGAVLMLNPGFIARISDLELSPTRIRFKLEEVAERQQIQQADIDKLKFLMTHFLSEWELEHLKKLESGAPFPYEIQGQFQDELRRLRALKLIDMRSISNLLPKGDLRSLARITRDGKQYLEWWRGGEAKHP